MTVSPASLGGGFRFYQQTGASSATMIMSINGYGSVGIGTVTPQAGLDVATAGTGASAIIVPRDTTTNRPSTAVNGVIRYNTTLTTLEGYQNGTWSSHTGGAQLIFGYTTVAQTPAAATWTDVALEESALTPTGGAVHSTTTNTPRMAVSNDRTYQVNYVVTFKNSAATGYAIGCRLRLNGTTEVAGSYVSGFVPGVSGASTQCVGSVVVSLLATDYFTLQAALANTVVSVNVSTAAAAPTTANIASVSVVRIR